MKISIWEKNKNRNSSVEILRMSFMVGIVLLHTYYHGTDGNIEWIYSLANSSDTSYQLSLYSLSRLGVTGFMFISGYYGIKMNAVRLYKLISMLIFYYVVTSPAFHNGITGGTLKGIVNVWDSWWFIASYFMICIISPAVNEGLARLTKRQFQYIVSGIIVYTYIGHFITGMDSHDTDLLLSIYIIARYVRLCVTPPEMRKVLLLGVLLTLMLIILPIFVMNLIHSVRLTDIIICNNSPLVLLSSASLVIYADKHRFHSGMAN